jgi:hypothetical protein
MYFVNEVANKEIKGSHHEQVSAQLDVCVLTQIAIAS